MFRATVAAAWAGEREVRMLVVLLRDRERGAVVDDRLHRRADRARVGDVVAEVRAVVDARGDEVEAVPEVAEEGEADGVGREPSTEYASEPSPSVRSRTRSGRISVFWWPTALWFVSGATTVVSPIGSRACLSASSPRDSTPSSFVIRIRGRLVQSLSGLAIGRSARGLPRGAPPATGSPRSLSRSRRSVRARSRVMSGTSPAAVRAVVRPLAPGRSPSGSRHVTSVSMPGAGSRGTRTGRPSRASTRLAARVGDRRGVAGHREVVEEERRQDGRDRDAEDRAGDARDLGSDQDGAEDDDRVDADGLLHQPRLEQVHDEQPADAHEDERGRACRRAL